MKKDCGVCYSLFDFDIQDVPETSLKSDNKNNTINETKNDASNTEFFSDNKGNNNIFVLEIKKRYDELMSNFPKDVNDVVDKTLCDFSGLLDDIWTRFYNEVETPLEDEISKLKQKLTELNKKNKSRTTEKKMIKEEISFLEDKLNFFKSDIDWTYLSFYDALSRYFGIPDFDNCDEYYKTLHDEFFTLLSEPASMEDLWNNTIKEIFDIAKKNVDAYCCECEESDIIVSETNISEDEKKQE